MPVTVDLLARAEPSRVRRSVGFSIAELLSAIVLLAVGTLGVAALYLDRTHEQERNPRTIATALAEEMAEHIRSRSPAEKAPRLQLAPFCTQPAEAQDALPGGDTLAQDVACWQEKVSNALPNGTGMVEKEDKAPGYRVTVSWSEAGVGAASVVLGLK